MWFYVLLLNVKTMYETKISSSTHSNRINRINRKFFVDGSSSIVNERIMRNRLCVFGNWFVGIDLKSSYKGAISIRNIFASIVHRQFLFPNQDFRFSIFKDLYNNSSQRRVNRRIFCFKILKNCLAQNLFTAINLWLILFYKRSKILRYISTRWSDSKFPYSSGCKNITT